MSVLRTTNDAYNYTYACECECEPVVYVCTPVRDSDEHRCIFRSLWFLGYKMAEAGVTRVERSITISLCKQF